MNVKNIDLPVLSYLSDEHAITIEELSKKLATSRADTVKQIQQLKQAGYSIIVDHQKGYRIISRPDILLPFAIKDKLATRYMGQTIYYFPELTSTNRIAKQKALKKTGKIPEGAMIIAEKQTGGKGRSGKIWFSPAGGIWLSIILYPELIPSCIPLITLMTAVAVAETISKLFPEIKVQIKWPNDLLIDDRKVCGILTETTTSAKMIQQVVVGIGMNVNNDLSECPEVIRKNALTLKEVTGQSIPRAALVRHLCLELESYYEKFKSEDFSHILEKWKHYNTILGKKINVDTGENIIDGEAIDINETGALILKTDEGEIKEIITGTILP